MFSVNIDKIVKMTSIEEKDYADVASVIKNKCNGECRTLAIIGGNINAFKLAYTFGQNGKRVLFIDADMDTEVFLGKYKLGKNLYGISDYIAGIDPSDKMICFTNQDGFDIVFSGSNGQRALDAMTQEKVDTFFKEYGESYDVIVLQSDDKGSIAKYCDASVVFCDRENYDEYKSQIKVDELDKMGCYVLGVIINE